MCASLYACVQASVRACGSSARTIGHHLNERFVVPSLMQDCIVLDVALSVHLQRNGLGASSVFAAHVEWILRDMDFWECAAVAKVRHLARHPALALALRRRLVLGRALGLHLGALLIIVVFVRPPACPRDAPARRPDQYRAAVQAPRGTRAAPGNPPHGVAQHTRSSARPKFTTHKL